MATLGVGQHGADVAYCDDCKGPVRAYFVVKDGVIIAAICPVKDHNRLCKISEKLSWD